MIDCRPASWWDGCYVYFSRVPLFRLWNLLNISIPFIVSLTLSLRTGRTLFPQHMPPQEFLSQSFRPPHNRWPFLAPHQTVTNGTGQGAGMQTQSVPLHCGLEGDGGWEWIFVSTVLWLLLPPLYFVVLLLWVQLKLVWSSLATRKASFYFLKKL